MDTEPQTFMQKYGVLLMILALLGIVLIVSVTKQRAQDASNQFWNPCCDAICNKAGTTCIGRNTLAGNDTIGVFTCNYNYADRGLPEVNERFTLAANRTSCTKLVLERTARSNDTAIAANLTKG